MRRGDENLPIAVEKEVGVLISELHSAGWAVSNARYDAECFGNWYVDVRHADFTMRLVKDRSQYLIHGLSTEEMKAAGLCRSFDDLQEFKRAIMTWAERATGGPGTCVR